MPDRTTSSTSPDPARTNRYLLVVDGDTHELFTTSMLLQRFSYPVCTARNARQALDMISVAMPALVITEMRLPDMTGMELLKLLGLTPRTFPLPVILVLPTKDTLVDRRYEIGGAIACLSKPLSVEQLYQAVQTAIEGTPRAHIRIPIRLPVSVNNTALNLAKGECATDLSEQGMYVRMRKPFSRNKKVSVGIDLSGRIVKAEAEVLYQHRFNDGSFQEEGMAIKFVKLAPDDREVIRTFVRDVVTRGLKPEKA